MTPGNAGSHKGKGWEEVTEQAIHALVDRPEPLVAILGLTVVRAREASGGHSQVVLRRERDVLDGIAFGWAELAALLGEGDRIDVVARLSSRRFGGFESLQLDIRDAARAGTALGPAAMLPADEAAAVATNATAPAVVPA